MSEIEILGREQKPYDEMTLAERLEFGREVAEDPTCHGMMRQGRPLLNVEMHAVTCFLMEERRNREMKGGAAGTATKGQEG